MPLRGGQDIIQQLRSYALVGFSGLEHGNCCFCVTFTSSNSLFTFPSQPLTVHFSFCRGFWVGGLILLSFFTYNSYINLLIEGANIRPIQVLLFFLPNFCGGCVIGICAVSFNFLGPIFANVVGEKTRSDVNLY